MSEVQNKTNETSAAKRARSTATLTAVCDVVLKGRVIASLICLSLAFSTLLRTNSVSAQSSPPGVRLQAGIEKEEADGDLPAAIAIYQSIAADTSAARDVRARALLRLARCDEKLGRQAKQIYEQILHDYADQPAAAQARNRLALLKQQEHTADPLSMTVSKIEPSVLHGMETSNTDGERAVYREGNNLYSGDLAGLSRHIILKNITFFGWVPSRDFSMVALNLLAIPNRPHTLAVIKTDGTGYRELIRDDEHSTIFGENSTFSINWSWDNRHVVLFDFSQKTGLEGRLWIVSV